TKEVLDAIQSKHSDVTLINTLDTNTTDLSGYDMIGFASGIYYSKFHKTVLEFAKQNLPEGAKTFFIYTYGVEKAGYTKAIRAAVALKNAKVLGEYSCLGFNTFGPFKIIGGIAKGHPTQEELTGASAFYETLL
ncbi:MAG: flavodoxin domain-containing protein, partial [Agathobacter sp.]